jgi:dTDP-4-amino-4,6-dideoxygalactose transaminase
MGLQGGVILPSFTFFATAHALLWNNLQPVFAECHSESFNIDPENIEALIGPSTSAIVAVHIFGNPADADTLERIAKRHRLRLIFDAAHAFGAWRNGRRVGAFGDAEVFSLSPTKLLVAGEGGLISTHDSGLAERLRAARNYGDAGSYDPVVLGLKSRLPELNAMLALHGLSNVDGQVKRRNQVAASFTEGLRELPGVSFQKIRAQDVSTCKDFSLLIDAQEFGLTRDDLAAALTEERVQVRKYFYPPLHQQKLYRRFYRPATQSLDVTERVSSRVLSLPIYSDLKDEDVTKLVESLHRIHACRGEVAKVLGGQFKVAHVGGER